MPKSTASSGRAGGFILSAVRGKVLDSIKVYQMEDALNLDIDFNDNTSLEFTARIGFQASANLLKFKDGNSTILKRISPGRVPKQ